MITVISSLILQAIEQKMMEMSARHQTLEEEESSRHATQLEVNTIIG